MNKQKNGLLKSLGLYYWDLVENSIALSIAAFIKLYLSGFFGLYEASKELTEIEKSLAHSQKQHLLNDVKEKGDFFVFVTFINLINITLTAWLLLTWLNKYI